HRFGNATELSPEIPERDELVRLQRDADAAGALVVHAGVNYSSPASSMPCCALSRRREVNTSMKILIASCCPPTCRRRTRDPYGGPRGLDGFLPLPAAWAGLWFTGTLGPELADAEFQGAVSRYAREGRPFGE